LTSFAIFVYLSAIDKFTLFPASKSPLVVSFNLILSPFSTVVLFVSSSVPFLIILKSLLFIEIDKGTFIPSSVISFELYSVLKFASAIVVKFTNVFDRIKSVSFIPKEY